MSETDPNTESPQPVIKPKKGMKGTYKILVWVLSILALSWFLQQMGPITVNGISLTVPVSE